MNKIIETINGKNIEVHRVDNDINGNPRYVIHFLYVAGDFQTALDMSRVIGGKMYRAKWFGGGIVFQSYDLRGDLTRLLSNETILVKK